MPIVGAGLGDDIELSARGVAVLGAELIGEQSKFGDRFLNDRLRRAVDVEAIVVHAVDRETVEARAKAADGTAGTLHAALLRCGAGRENGEFFYVAAERVDGEIVDHFTGERSAEFGRLGLDEFSASFDFDDRGNVADFESRIGFGDLVRFDLDSLEHGFAEAVFFDRDVINADGKIREYVRTGAGGGGRLRDVGTCDWLR